MAKIYGGGNEGQSLGNNYRILNKELTPGVACHLGIPSFVFLEVELPVRTGKAPASGTNRPVGTSVKLTSHLHQLFSVQAAQLGMLLSPQGPWGCTRESVVSAK